MSNMFLEHVHEQWSLFLFQLLQKAAKHAIVARGIARIPRSNADVQTIDCGAKSAKWSRFSPTLTYVSLTPQPSSPGAPGAPATKQSPSTMVPRRLWGFSNKRRWNFCWRRCARFEDEVMSLRIHWCYPRIRAGTRVRSRLLSSWFFV